MKNKSLILKIFIYLSIFTCLILFLIWLFQIILLNQYYEYYKTDELNQTIALIKKQSTSDELYNTLENISYNTDFCVEIIKNNETVYSSIQDNKGCINTNSNTKILKNKLEFMTSDKEYFKLKIINPKFNNLTLLYGVRLSDNNYTLNTRYYFAGWAYDCSMQNTTVLGSGFATSMESEFSKAVKADEAFDLSDLFY